MSRQARRLGLAWCVAGALALAAPAVSAAPAKPKNATAKCTDGSYSTAKTHRGACTGHGGVATWYKEPKDDASASKGDSKAPVKSDRKAPKSEPAPSARTSAKSAPVEKTAPEKTPAAPKAPPATPTPKPAPAAKGAPLSAPPTGAPENATAQCNDGTYSFAKQHRGACSNHKGVKTWFK